MKNIFITLLVFLTFTLTQAFAYNMNEFSNDATIQQALRVLEQNGQYDVFNNLKKNAVKIKFYSLAGYGSSVYATNSYDSTGRRVILINSIYKNAPIEQIACLVAHESCHTARRATLDEETRATSKEAAVWVKLKNDSVTYPETKLTKRLNKLADLYLASDNGNDYIHDKIANSSFYKTQFGLN